MLFVAQSVAGGVVLFTAAVVGVAKGGNPGDPAFVPQLTRQVMVPLLIASGVVSGIVIFVAARLWAWEVVFDRSANGIGLKPVKREQLFAWSLVGCAVAALFLAVIRWVVPFDQSTPLGPLAAAAAAGGINRVAWALFAVVYAPVVEELLFRGLLLRGFAASWGSAAGGAVVTGLFVMMHLAETIHYWPAIIAILFLSIGTLAARTMTGSLHAAVAVHLAYNVTVTLSVFAGRGLS